MNQNANTDPVNALILKLYQGATNVPFSRFQDWALEQLCGVIRFDAAWWGKALSEPQKILRVQISNASEDMLKDYERVQEHDFFRDAMLAALGTTINLSDLITRKDFERSPLYTRYGRKHRIETAIGTVLLEPVSSMTEFLSIWRFDARWPFSDTDRARKERLMPHLVEANRISRLVSLGKASHSGEGKSEIRPWAVVGADDACLIEVNGGFVELAKREWPEWRGAIMPVAIRKNILQAQPYAGEHIYLDITNVDGYRLILARPIMPIDRLGRRERVVVQRFCAGQSYREIAAELGTAPATVRNQLSQVYVKLNVHNRIELLGALSSAGIDPELLVPPSVNQPGA
jgi:DNA-binding CsgD family transcriptional regulator